MRLTFILQELIFQLIDVLDSDNVQPPHKNMTSCRADNQWRFKIPQRKEMPRIFVSSNLKLCYLACRIVLPPVPPPDINIQKRLVKVSLHPISASGAARRFRQGLDILLFQIQFWPIVKHNKRILLPIYYFFVLPADSLTDLFWQGTENCFHSWCAQGKIV